ncbi:hypothetical protein GOODEAATRI_001720 [Goodea atripinnis]|uniref:Dopa decarboxylase n=1 Tax=Goodea atripinnis TaxID=208336 RepID=A0ABV0PK11_9TELE
MLLIHMQRGTEHSCRLYATLAEPQPAPPRRRVQQHIHDFPRLHGCMCRDCFQSDAHVRDEKKGESEWRFALAPLRPHFSRRNVDAPRRAAFIHRDVILDI